jgi:hypothetical protein
VVEGAVKKKLIEVALPLEAINKTAAVHDQRDPVPRAGRLFAAEITRI